MAMIQDFLKQYKAQEAGKHRNPDPGIELPLAHLKNGMDAENDKNNMTPDQYQNNKKQSDSILKDDGTYSTDQTPFDIQKYLNGPAEKGTLRNFLQRLQGNPDAPAVDPLSGGQATDKQLDPAPTAVQRGSDLSPVPDPAVPLPVPRPAAADYSQPTALDPVSIEQLRQSLLTQAGQLDPNNPNGLSGMMNGPNSNVDEGQQRNQAMGIEDSIRGFDGGQKPPNPNMTDSNANTGGSNSSMPDLSAALANMI